MTTVLYGAFHGQLGGAELALVGLLDTLDRDRFRPIVVVAEPGPLVEALGRRAIPTLTEPRMRFITRRDLRPGEILAAIRTRPRVVEALARVVREQRVGLVHAFVAASLGYAGRAACVAGVPVVGTVHEPLGAFAWPRRRLLVAGLNRFCRGVTVPSEASRAMALRYGVRAERVTVVRTGIDVDRFQADPAAGRRVRDELGLRPDTPLVGMVARFNRGKGHDILVRAMALVAGFRPEARCVLVGDALFAGEHAWKARILALTRELGLGDRVAFAGWRALRSGEFDLVACYPPPDAPWQPTLVAALARRLRWRAGWGLLRQLGPFLLVRPTATPLVVLDLADHPVIMRHNFRLLDRCRAYFKRELPADHWKAFLMTNGRRLPTPRQRQSARMREWVAKLHPLSAGLTPQRLAAIAASGSPEKTVDVFFAGRVESSSTVRSEGARQLEDLRRQGYRIDLALERMPVEEFYARCARAWLAWSPEGYGWDCFRHYEAPLCGAVPVINYPTVRRYAPLEEGVHCFYYGVEGAGLARVITGALQDKPRLVAMAEAGREHVLRHHTVERLCEHVVATCLGSPPEIP